MQLPSHSLWPPAGYGSSSDTHLEYYLDSSWQKPLSERSWVCYKKQPIPKIQAYMDEDMRIG